VTICTGRRAETKPEKGRTMTANTEKDTERRGERVIGRKTGRMRDESHANEKAFPNNVDNFQHAAK